MSLFKSSFIFSVFTFLSRVLGFIRDYFMAFLLGTSIVTDAFVAAFRIANLLRRFFAEGSFNAAFIPIYHDCYYNQSIDLAKDFIQKILVIFLCMLIMITLLAEIFMPQIIAVVTPGFLDNTELFSLTVDYARLCAPYLLFIVMAAFFGSFLNAHQRFVETAAAPILLNVVLIASMAYAYYVEFDLIYIGFALSIAVFVAGVMQFSFLTWRAWYLQNELEERDQKAAVDILDDQVSSLSMESQKNDAVMRFFKRFLPTLTTTGIYQVNLLIGTIFASFYDSAMSYLYYADRLIQLPLALIGISVGTVFLSSLSQHIKTQSNSSTIQEYVHQAIKLSLFLGLPATMGLLVMHYGIIEAVYGYGKFAQNGGIAINITAKLLLIYSLALPAYILHKTITSIFFANDNTKYPLYVTMMGVMLNVILVFILIPFYSFYAIAIAHVISSWAQLLVLLFLTHSLGYHQCHRAQYTEYMHILVLVSCLGGVLYYAYHFYWIEQLPMIWRIAQTGLIVAVFMVVYFGLAWALGIYTRDDLKHMR